MSFVHLRSVAEARSHLRRLWQTGSTIGSIHTLGALHRAHGELIKQSAAENDHTIVTIYPNKIQLFPGSSYQFDLERDVELARASGATVVISSTDAEMYPETYATFLDQSPASQRLNSSVFDFASRGQVTGAIRWISLCRPTVTYFGMKDIEQSLLVRRAVEDLLIDCEVRHVPCIRFRDTGVPVSSRLAGLPADRLREVGAVYRALDHGRQLVAAGETDASAVVASIRGEVQAALSTFDILYVTAVDAEKFARLAELRRPPFVLHCAISDGILTHFDGLPILDERDLAESPDVIWV